MVDTTRLVRQKPFGEWVNVFYDPKEIDPATLLELIRKNNCPKAAHTKAKNGNLLNPFIAPGDPVQIKLSLTQASKVDSKTVLPQGWTFASDQELKKGENILTLKVPKKVKQGTHRVRIVSEDGNSVECEVIVVEQVGKH